MEHVKQIFLAASTGDHETLKSFISASMDVDCVDEEDSTPLMYAAANGHEKAVRLLLDHGVQVDRQNRYKWTALLQASCYGHQQVVYTLLQRGALINAGNCWGTTPLVAASQGGFMSMVQYLLDQGALVNTENEVEFVTPLMVAAQCGSDAIVEKLISKGSNVNARKTISGWTALMLAALNNHVGVVRMLLNNGASKEVRNVNNNRAIDLALALKHYKVVDILAENDMNSISTEIDVFDLITQGQAEKLQEVLGEHKTVPLTVTDKDGITLLMHTAKKGNTQICQLLLDMSIDVDVQDYTNGWTAFMHAVHNKHHLVAQLLAKYNANVTLKARNGSSAFDIANLIGDVKMIQLIAQATIQHLTRGGFDSNSKLSPLPPLLEEPIQSPRHTSPDNILPPPSPLRSLSPLRSITPLSDNGEIEDDEKATTDIILRRLSNAYSASGTPHALLQKQDSKGFLLPVSPLFPRSPSPSPNPDDIVLPAVTKPLPTTPPISSPSPPTTIEHKPQQQQNLPAQKPVTNLATERKPILIEGNKMRSPTSAVTKLPKLQFAIPTTTAENAGKFVSLSRDTPPILKSPRSLPSDPFSFLKSSSSPVVGAQRSFLKDESNNNYNILSRQSKSSTRLVGGGGFRNGGPSNNWLNIQHSKAKTKNPLRLKSIPNRGPDLKTALHNASLGQYYNLFKEEQIDMDTFLTLSETDLIEVGVSSPHDRTKFMALIGRLCDNPSPRSPRSPRSPGKPDFAFQYSLQ